MDHATSMRNARREAETFSPALRQALDELGDTNPGLARAILEDGVGRVMRNSALDHREWAMLVLVSLIAIGDTGDQLHVYLEAARRQGASVDEIHSAIELACAYVGA